MTTLQEFAQFVSSPQDVSGTVRTFSVGDHVMKIKGVDAGQVGFVERVFDSGKIDVRNKSTSRSFSRQSAKNFKLEVPRETSNTSQTMIIGGICNRLQGFELASDWVETLINPSSDVKRIAGMIASPAKATILNQNAPFDTCAIANAHGIIISEACKYLNKNDISHAEMQHLIMSSVIATL